jgi:hypothetical protein
MALLGLPACFFSCESPAGGETGADPVTVTDLNLTGKISAPVKFNQIITGLNAPQYTGTIAWETEEGGPVTEPYFAAATEYRATISLRAKTGYTFAGTGADSFVYSSYGHGEEDEPAGRITNAADSGVITVSFPATAGAYADTMVTLFSLDGKVPAPVPGEAPATSLETYQYSGTIAWINGAGFEATGSFGVSTAYSAAIILSAKTGYTFAGTPENAFVHESAGSVAHVKGSNSIYITFPETASGEVALVDDLSLDAKITFPRFDELPVIFFAPTDQYNGVIDWQTGAGVEFEEEPFGAAAVYRAVLTLTARPGWTFSGLGANAFSYAAASSVANGAGSDPGTITVTVTFPKTMSLPPTWTMIPAGTTGGTQTTFRDYEHINGIAYGNGKYFAVGRYGKIAYSTDGAAWYSVTHTLGSTDINSIIYDGPPGGKMFVVGINGRVATSPDGTIWTERIASGGILGASAVTVRYASAQEKFFAFASSKVASSPDGETWTACPDRPNSNAVAYLNGKFVSTSFNSTDGSTWTEHEPALGGTNVRGMAYGGPAGREKYVAGGSEGAMAWSEDGEHWTQLRASVFGSSYIYDITYGGGIFLAAGGGGKMAYSVDGVFWKLIPAGSTGTTFPSTDTINYIAYLNGKFFASSSYMSGTNNSRAGKIAYSAPYNEGE